MHNGDFEGVAGNGRRRRRGRGIWIAAALTACLASGAGGASLVSRAAGPATAPAQVVEQITSLEDSTRPLEEYFNQTKNQARFLALLSPT